MTRPAGPLGGPLGWTVSPRRTAAMLDEPFDAFEDDDVDDLALVEFL